MYCWTNTGSSSGDFVQILGEVASAHELGQVAHVAVALAVGRTAGALLCLDWARIVSGGGGKSYYEERIDWIWWC